MPHCLFCDDRLSNENRSREHIVPGWLLDSLGVRDDEVTPTHQSARGEVLSTRSHDYDSLRNGRICARCNNGWMSQMETAVQPVLHRLLHATVVPSALTSPERLLLARWSAKVSWLLNDASNYRKLVPAGAFRHLHDHFDSLPGRTIVTLSMAPGKTPLWWIQAPTWLASTLDDFPPDHIKALAERSLKVGLRFGPVNLVVGWWPEDGWQYYVVRDFHEVLWPSDSVVGSYSDDLPVDIEYDPLLSAHALIQIRQAGAEEPKGKSARRPE